MVFRWIVHKLYKMTGRNPAMLRVLQNLDSRAIQGRIDAHRLFLRTRYYYLRTLDKAPPVEQLEAEFELLDHGVRACVCNVNTVYAKPTSVSAKSILTLDSNTVYFLSFTPQSSMHLQTSVHLAANSYSERSRPNVHINRLAVKLL